jgi:hypothetical protein
MVFEFWLFPPISTRHTLDSPPVFSHRSFHYAPHNFGFYLRVELDHFVFFFASLPIFSFLLRTLSRVPFLHPCGFSPKASEHEGSLPLRLRRESNPFFSICNRTHNRSATQPFVRVGRNPTSTYPDFCFFFPYFDREDRRFSTPPKSKQPRTTLYCTPGRSRTRPPRTNTVECSCSPCPPSPGI